MAISPRRRLHQLTYDWMNFHRQNPFIYLRFRQFALEACESRSKFSMYMVRERVRWFTSIETNEEFKLSNDYTPYYARLFIFEFPEHRSKFKLNPAKAQELSANIYRNLLRWR